MGKRIYSETIMGKRKCICCNHVFYSNKLFICGVCNDKRKSCSFLSYDGVLIRKIEKFDKEY